MAVGVWFTEDQQEGIALSFKIKNILVSTQTPWQKLAIYETATCGLMLTLDDIVMTTEKDEFVYHELIAHVPLFAHPQPERVLVIGGGDGGTVREVVKHPQISAIDLVEIDEVVVRLSQRYMPFLAHALTDPKVRLLFEDGVEFVNRTTSTYDIIIIDSTDPIGPGEGLFNRAFYHTCSQRLRDGGILVAQAESPFDRPDWVSRTFATLRQVFPLVTAYTGVIPTYPGGIWCFALCCKEIAPTPSFDAPRYQQLQLPLRYYNRDIHHACFALPEYVKKLIE
ncbi:polyamine aminopropyltransferase [candidate division KSB3 bacterium]|uniref:Polyamine aminopropyltransferase n=1 Tax=candidate division KSB3 bacterium TaxID=2044937 RepID=A0A9D5JXG5_9BACT|nr:polyamine aminopropyltransferase [candidate division KSB3 bacterium]MBD3326102.1 polyamine aminopropyltransferase [candidate division KSB3 bacterium]